MKKSKLLSLLGLTATSALVLAACGGDGDTTDTGSQDSGSSEEQVLNLIESAELPNMDSAKNNRYSKWYCFEQRK